MHRSNSGCSTSRDVAPDVTARRPQTSARNGPGACLIAGSWAMFFDGDGWNLSTRDPAVDVQDRFHNKNRDESARHDDGAERHRPGASADRVAAIKD